MATDVDVQYFSHLNGLVLGNNWGDLIRLLDKALVTGIDFTQITAASIDAQGDVHITLYAAHNAMLFQVVELSGFTPPSLNQKYRIKGVPNTTQLILKPHAAIVETSVTTVGAGKLASLGYDIIFRDANDVKRVYRAKNPTSEHPFIRVDESLTSPDGTTGVYTSNYAKYAMVGLLEHMEHIDDYENPDVLQLPFDPSDPVKNWKITGTGTSVVRGWNRWYWATDSTNGAYFRHTSNPINSNRGFSLVGDADAFYLNVGFNTLTTKAIWGCGLFAECISNPISKQWFLMAGSTGLNVGEFIQIGYAQGFSAITISDPACTFSVTPINLTKNTKKAIPIVPDFRSGFSNIYSANHVSALQIPFVDSDKCLRGSLKHIYYMGKQVTTSHATPTISESSMYIIENVRHTADPIEPPAALGGGVYFYLGELE